MTVENPNWFNFEKPSTFTHIARNDRAVDWISGYRQEHKMPTIRKVGIIGSGMVEPFTLAALPGLSSAQIFAIEINPELVYLGEQIKKGKAIPWSNIAGSSHNPEMENSDFTDPKRLRSGLDRLKALGSLDKLGNGFNTRTMQVASAVADRVIFIHDDALQAMKMQKDSDLVVDCFVRVNMIKMKTLGPEYTKELTTVALQSLAENGMYLIGDTGASLPATLGDFTKTLSGNVNCASLVHVVQIGPDRLITSHYTVASLMEGLDTDDLQNQARAHVVSHSPNVYKDYTITVDSLAQVYDQLVTLGLVNLAYVGGPKKKGLAINMPIQGLFKLVPNEGDEFSPPADEKGNGIIFPPQK